jgi:hypothetical protein
MPAETVIRGEVISFALFLHCLRANRPQRPLNEGFEFIARFYENLPGEMKSRNVIGQAAGTQRLSAGAIAAPSESRCVRFSELNASRPI